MWGGRGRGVRSIIWWVRLNAPPRMPGSDGATEPRAAISILLLVSARGSSGLSSGSWMPRDSQLSLLTGTHLDQAAAGTDPHS